MLRIIRISLLVAVVLAVLSSQSLAVRVIYRSYDRSAKVFAGQVRIPGAWATVIGWPFAGGGPFGLAGTHGDARGRYWLRAPRGTSRTLRLYVAHRVQTVVEEVSPSLWITVRPRGSGRVLFDGGEQIASGTPLATVIIQAYTPFGWRTFGAANPNVRSHLWRFSYHASPGEIGKTFAFRVASLPVSRFYVRGASPLKWATIR